MSQPFHTDDPDDMTKGNSSNDDYTAKLMRQLQRTLFEGIRQAVLRQIRDVCERSLRHEVVSQETMVEFFTMLVSLVAVSGSENNPEEGLETMAVVDKFFKHLAVSQHNPDSPFFSGKGTPLHPDVAKILRDLEGR